MNKKNNLHSVRGMPDLFGDLAKIFQHIIKISNEIALQYNFQFLEMPIVDFVDTFERAIGESSDIINKEIYRFLDRSENNLALRPEFTASVMRAVATNKMQNNLPLKLFSYGQIFRYDRPQKCRQRQFNQINYEFVGIKHDAYFDAQMIMIACVLLKKLGLVIKNDFLLEINSIGSKEVRERFSLELQNYLQNYASDLSVDSQLRLQKNPLRILDSKCLKDQEIITFGPKIYDFYDSESNKFFTDLQNYLTMLDIDFVVNDKLVRGLDYYTHSVFEITTNKLGAQSTILAGGRYHNLSEFFGLGTLPCFGFAGGIERISALIEKDFSANNLIKLAILIIEDINLSTGMKIFQKFISKNLPSNVVIDFLVDNKLQKLLSKADKQGFNWVVFVGEKEIQNNSFVIRNLSNGVQFISTREELVDSFLFNIN